MDETPRTDLHARLLDRFGPRGEALYVFATGSLAIAVNGFAAYLLKQPLLFPSLSPTVFAFFRKPLSREANPRNAVVGHLVALAVGYAALRAFGLAGEPSVLQEGVTLARIGAAVSSVALTEALLVLIRAPHTPAGTTTLLVSLGVFATTRELVSIAAGIVLVTTTGWAINRGVGVPVPLWAPRDKEG